MLRLACSLSVLVDQPGAEGSEWERTHLSMWVPDHLLDVLGMMVEDTGTLILLPLLHHWIHTHTRRKHSGKRYYIQADGSIQCWSFIKNFLMRVSLSTENTWYSRLEHTFPYPDTLVATAGGQERARGREGSRLHLILVTLQ